MAAKVRFTCGYGGIANRIPEHRNNGNMQPPIVTMEDKMKESTEVLTMLRNELASLSSIAKRADLPALAFLIGMAELEATQVEVAARREAIAER